LNILNQQFQFVDEIKSYQGVTKMRQLTITFVILCGTLWGISFFIIGPALGLSELSWYTIPLLSSYASLMVISFYGAEELNEAIDKHLK